MTSSLPDLNGEDVLRRLVLNLNTSALLSGTVAANGEVTARDINRAVQIGQDVDKAVRKRMKWEKRERPAKGGPR